MIQSKSLEGLVEVRKNFPAVLFDHSVCPIHRLCHRGFYLLEGIYEAAVSLLHCKLGEFFRIVIIVPYIPAYSSREEVKGTSVSLIIG